MLFCNIHSKEYETTIATQVDDGSEGVACCARNRKLLGGATGQKTDQPNQTTKTMNSTIHQTKSAILMSIMIHPPVYSFPQRLCYGYIHTNGSYL